MAGVNIDASSGVTRKASDDIPHCKGQGIPYLCGAASPGVSVQSKQWPMPVGGVITFAELGFATMDGAYQVHIHNHTGAVQGTVANGDRLPDQITVAGPTTADVLDIMVVGKLKGQRNGD